MSVYLGLLLGKHWVTYLENWLRVSWPVPLEPNRCMVSVVFSRQPWFSFSFSRIAWTWVKKKIYIKRQKRLFNNSLIHLILHLLNSNFFFIKIKVFIPYHWFCRRLFINHLFKLIKHKETEERMDWSVNQSSVTH